VGRYRLSLLACLLTGCLATGDAIPDTHLVATVDQAGPVGYRDPIGALSPDGKWLALGVQEHLRLRDLGSGVEREIPAGATRVAYLSWRDDGLLLVGQEDQGVAWWLVNPATGARIPLWPAGQRITGRVGEAEVSTAGSDLRHLTWSPAGSELAGIQTLGDSSRAWVVDSAGRRATTWSGGGEWSYPAWLPNGRIACLVLSGGRQRVTLPCGGETPPGLATREAFGPLAAAPDGGELYFGSPNDSGFVDLWAWDLAAGNGRVLARFPRDAYGPSVAADGTVLFKVQEYSTRIAVVPAAGGDPVIRTSFQAETPSWDPSGQWIGITYGTWRRLIDDFNYPDIAQEAGIIPADGDQPASRPDRIVQDSPSEDQGLTWSPNGRWIAFHSHQLGSDDIWLRRADLSDSAVRITTLGRGAEVGWPRWSPDGRWITFGGDADVNGQRRGLLWVVGVDQENGAVTMPMKGVPLAGLEEDVVHAEWLGSSDVIGFSTSGEAGAHALYQVARTGGTPRLIHRWTSPQRVDGFGASADGTWLVIVAPDSAGVLQLFRIEVSGTETSVQLTSDPAQKTQPAVSPDGNRIAYTEWSYQARFYTVRP
jgi:Tol biopolymer transport system component